MPSTLGFACAWRPDRRETWSGTPWRLRAALAEAGPVVDVPEALPRPVELGLKGLSARRIGGRWTSMYRHGAAFRALTGRRMAAGLRGVDVDAVVMVQDLAVLPVPYLVVQDLSYDVLLRHVGPAGVPHFPGLGRSAVERFRDRQLEVYAGAAALLPMSGWLAGELVRSGVPAAKVFPVHPGANTALSDAPVPERRRGPGRRLLFVGRDPHTKGLDQVVAALAQLRRELGPGVTLTVAGPAAWPLPGPVPDGVEHLGPVGRDVVGRLLDSHDLFVMPSRLEGFGIAFVEALSRGLPCVARDAFAMPEIVRPGTGGALVGSEDPAELAAVVAAALADDELYRRCAAEAPAVRAHYTWSRAAAEIRDVVAKVT